MRKVRALSAAGLAGIVLLLASQGVWAKPLQYHGGPVLETVTIHPLYWGYWSKEDKDAQQTYLKHLAAYMSGESAPKGQEPVLKQYGVNKVVVDDNERTADPNQSCKSATCDMKRDQLAGPKGGPLLNSSIIRKAQLRKNDPLPAFGPHTLIVVFLPHHYVLTDCAPFPSCGAAYHSSESASEFWAVVPQDDTPATTAHEMFEAAADPADDNSPAWDEVADPCGKKPLITLKDFGSIQIPQVADNTQGGDCNTTGYIPIQKKFDQISFNIVTGADDLRGDSSATASISFPEGPQVFKLKSQSDAGWPNNSDHVKTFTITGPSLPIGLFGPVIITLTSHNGFAETDDNWNLRSIEITATGSGGSGCVLKESGTPRARLTGSSPSVTLLPRAGC